MLEQSVNGENAAAGALPLELRRTETVLERMRGLLGRPPLRRGQALLIDGCNMVHTVGMGYAIDIVFVDRAGSIRRICAAVPPWRARSCLRARRVIELAAGEAARRGWAPGMRLAFAAEAP
ncbi:MAG: DUF192 domain-containing protein [Roseateles sp.]|uniref:DUF192 domain-containing protein n=1 Tax=Roseateles sp. TaxID=1971397 RepID=UPI0039EB7E59